MKFYKQLLFAAIAIIFYQCSTPSDHPLSPRVNHVMLYVSDLDVSIDFYTKAFGLEVTSKISSLSFENEDGTKTSVEIELALLKFPGQDFVYEMAEVARTEDEGEGGNVVTSSHLFQHVGIDVTDIDAALQRALDAGAKLAAPVRLVTAEDVKAKNAFVTGPDGEMIEFMQIIEGEF